jgi:hypothetical protein
MGDFSHYQEAYIALRGVPPKTSCPPIGAPAYDCWRARYRIVKKWRAF